MRSAEFSILLHRALEMRLGRFVELTANPGWAIDPEGLHQVRVVSRRVRAVLDLADPDMYPGFKRRSRKLRQLTEVLGLTRELDVHVSLLEELGHRLPGPGQWAALEHALEIIDRRRRKARKVMLNDLADLELEGIVRLLEMKGLTHPLAAGELRRETWDCLSPMVSEALRPLQELTGIEDALALHGERIRIKKLRYTLEILAPTFPEVPEERLARLKSLQTVLGYHHDYATLEARLRDALAEIETRNRPVLSEGLHEILRFISGERAYLFERFRSMAGGFPAEAFAEGLRSELGLEPNLEPFPELGQGS